MEITVTPDSTVLAAAQALATSSGSSLEEAIVELARRGAAAPTAADASASPPLGDSYSPLPRMATDDASAARASAPEVRGT
jgi:hypothetical protein